MLTNIHYATGLHKVTHSELNTESLVYTCMIRPHMYYQWSFQTQKTHLIYNKWQLGSGCIDSGYLSFSDRNAYNVTATLQPYWQINDCLTSPAYMPFSILTHNSRNLLPNIWFHLQTVFQIRLYTNLACRNQWCRRTPRIRCQTWFHLRQKIDG